MTPKKLKEIAAAGYNRFALKREVLADLDTPLSIYLKLANTKHSYIFESAEGGKHWGRYSFIGLTCNEVVKLYGQEFIHEVNGQELIRKNTDDPIQEIKAFNAKFKVFEPDATCRFNGGLVGYFGYDTVRYIEKRLHNNAPYDELKVPDIFLMVSDDFVVFDNLLGTIHFVTYIDPKKSNALKNGEEKIDRWVDQFRSLSIHELEKKSFLKQNIDNTRFNTDIEHSTKEHTYQAYVKKIKSYIKNGDVMQVVLSQRAKTPYEGAPVDVYRALRRLNPSPYMYYLNMGDFQIIGSSPEILARLENNKTTIRPLAGTRPRGRCIEEDTRLENELLNDAKEIAEHLMLIDLGRNDIGRIAKGGSVKVTEKMTIERFSHVMHISSNIEAYLAQGYDCLDLLLAVLPAGTLSGAPKIRAMEIIDELESVKRNIYGGSVGYLSWNGNMDMAIALRTAIVKDKTLYAQAGAGIVHDSDPNSEWQETINKNKAVLQALNAAKYGIL